MKRIIALLLFLTFILLSLPQMAQVVSVHIYDTVDDDYETPDIKGKIIYIRAGQTIHFNLQISESDKTDFEITTSNISACRTGRQSVIVLADCFTPLTRVVRNDYPFFHSQ